MFEFVVDDEVVLKLLDTMHANQLSELTDSCRPYLKEWLPWVDGSKNVEDTKTFIEMTKKQFASNAGFQAGIWYKGSFAGVIGFHEMNGSNKSTSIGYWLGPTYQGNGIMTKACKALLDYAFGVLKLNRVEVRCAEGNSRSRAIPERLGFVKEGISREAEWLYDHYVDHVVYGILSREWALRIPDHSEVYQSKASKYELLISREDYEGNIGRTLREICSFTDKDIIDMGAGTGRLTCLAASEANSMIAFDLSPQMLEVTSAKLTAKGLSNWRTEVADHRSLPIDNHSTDVVLAGWSICYLGSTNLPNWQNNIKSVMGEMKRVVRPGGILIILETLGTGNEAPNPPEFLTEYYKLLKKFGFSHKAIRTDYQFQSTKEAEDLTRFFFGNELANKINEQGMTILPECTGVWWLNM